MASASPQFVHLHVHSQFSLLDGACRAGDLVARARELGMSALAVTDHGCLFGVIDFYQKARAAGVKPIVGIEAYMAPGSRLDRTATGVKDGGYHLLLLAQDRQGYANLLKLSSIAYLEGFYYKPRIDRETLKAHSAGLLCTSACLGGEIPDALMKDNRKRAREIAEAYLAIFGPERFFIELQKHIPEQDKVNPELIDLADKLGVGVVASNDVHFLLEEDHAPHDALICIGTARLLSDQSRMRYPTQLFLKSPQQMRQASDLPRWQEACDNTLRIADRCNLELDFKASHAPAVRIQRPPRPASDPSAGADDAAATSAPVGSTAWYQDFCAGFNLLPFDSLKERALTPADLKAQCDDALRELAQAGLIWRYGRDGVTDEHRARLERELKVLADKSISAYFLIVWDFVNEARRRGIPANARGSGVGTMVGYCLGLSNACPVRYGLLFERFTDPDRSEYPDIDIDICQDGRQEIIDYVRQKYGHVAQIITFGSLKARAALRDVGRVLNVPLPDVDRVCKLVGEALGTTIGKALDQEPDLRRLCQESPAHQQMIQTAQRLEGLARHAGVHAAGVIVATQPLDNIVPLAMNKQGEREQIITQWDGPTCEKMGLLKMDFLGLRTLSIIERAKRLIRATLSPQTIRATVAGGPGAASRPPDRDPLDLDRLTYDDPRVFALFGRGETAGIFQFESGGMRNLLVGMKPDRLEDLIAANALFRPGPMELIPDYIERKHGRQPVPRTHPIVDRHTADTYGVMVYQEQVMQICHELGGIPLRAAYTLIKNISKKKQKEIDAVRPGFVEGAGRQGLSRKQADELFELILKFAGYGFNKSHSTGYAIIAYQTAYLKTWFPVHYMAALLTYESVSIEKVVEYVEECRRVVFPDPAKPRGVDVRPPDINLSDLSFTVVYDPQEPRASNHGHIRFGLSAVKGVGDKAITAILEARGKGGPFASLFDFCERVSLGSVNRATIEALIKCGAFDSLHGAERRAALMEALDGALAAGQRAASDRASGQMAFFGPAAAPAGPAKGGNTGGPSGVRLPNVPPWPHHEQLKHEKSVLGFYLSSHPLDRQRDLLERFASVDVAEIEQLAADMEVVVGGMLTRLRPTVTKQGKNPGQKMAMISIEDGSGQIEGTLFPEAYAIAAPHLAPDAVLFLRGKVDRRRERPSLTVNQVIPADQAASMLTQSVRIVLREGAAAPAGGGRGSSPGPGDASPGADVADPAVAARLARLKELLRQAALANGNGYGHGHGGGRHGQAALGPRPAAVFLEVHQAGQVVHLRVDGLRVAVTADLPQRVATVLEDADCCQLVGPPRLRQLPGYSHMLHRDSAPAAPLLRREAAEDEFCESIDRY